MLHNSYSLGALENRMESNKTDASSVDKNERVVISHVDSKKVLTLKKSHKNINRIIDVVILGG
jgi:hypothetical protein